MVKHSFRNKPISVSQLWYFWLSYEQILEIICLDHLSPLSSSSFFIFFIFLWCAIRSSSTSDSFGLAVRQVNIWRREKFDELFSNKKILKGYQFKIYLQERFLISKIKQINIRLVFWTIYPVYSHYQAVNLNEIKDPKQASLWMSKFSGIRGIDLVQYPCMMWANEALFNFLPC